MSKNLIKWGGVSALAGGILACLLTPLMSVGYYQAYGAPGETPPFWFSAMQPSLSFLFSFAEKNVAYATYGKVFAIVYLLFLPGIWALHKLQEKAVSRFEKFGFAFLLFALTVSFLGVSLDYWGIKQGWTVELFGMLLLQIAATVYGVASFRTKVISPSLALFFSAAIPLCVVAFLLVKQIPSAPTLPFAIASIAAGAFIIQKSKMRMIL